MMYLHFDKAEDIYMTAGWESIYRNVYLHGSRSRAKSAINTAAVCPHERLYTRQTFKAKSATCIYIAAGCVHKIVI